MKIINKTIGIILFFLISVPVYSQTKYNIANTKEIVINYKDSIVESNILLVCGKMNIDNSLFYYWYGSDNIFVNRGGFAGNLLQGKYLVFDVDEKLKKEGFFNNGIMEGVWKQWHNNGELAFIENWEEGKKNGVQRYYDSKGNLIKQVHYKDGLIHGDLITYIDNTTLKKEYRRGLEIIKKEKKRKNSKTGSSVESTESNKENHFVKFFQFKKKKPDGNLNEDKLEKESKNKKESIREKEKSNNLLFWKREKKSDTNKIEQKKEIEEKQKKEPRKYFKKKKQSSML